MNKFTSHKSFIGLLSLGFALLLFFNANSEGSFFFDNKVTDKEAAFSAYAEKVPITIKYDDSQFFISDVKDSTSVELTSSNRILLDTEANSETRNFSLEVDLNNLKEGTHTAPVEVENLASGVNATLGTSEMTVTLEKRETKTFKVHTKISDNLLKNGYTLENITVSPDVIAITTGNKTMAKISDVIVSVEPDKEIAADYSKKYDVYAVDKQGNILSVIADPATVTVDLHVSAPSKSVPIKFVQSGKIPDGIEKFTFASSTQNVEIFGTRDAIDKVSEVSVLVDTSTIKKTTTGSFQIEAIDNVQMEPSTVTVTVTPVLKETNKQSSEKK